MELELVKDGCSLMVIPVLVSVPDFSEVKARVSREELENSNFLTIETGSPTMGRFFIDIQLSEAVSGDFTWNLSGPKLENFSVIAESQLGGDIEVNSIVTTDDVSESSVAAVGPTVLLQVIRLRLEGTFAKHTTTGHWNTPVGLITMCRFTSLFVPEYSWPVFGGLYTAFQLRRESPLIRVKVVSFPFNSDEHDDESFPFPQQARIEISVVLKKHRKGAIEFKKNNNDGTEHFSQEISSEKELDGTAKRVFDIRTKIIVYLNASAPPPRRCYRLMDFVVLGANKLDQFRPINFVRSS